MTLTDRDRKIMLGLLPLLLIAAYWFLLLKPKMDERATAEAEAVEQVERRDAAQALVAQGSADQNTFAADYGEIVRLGKAIPAKVDMPSLLVQLDEAADGTGIHFTKILMGERTAVATTAPTTTPAPSTGTETTPTDAGGAPAQSAPGAATESANEAAATSEQRSDAAESSGVDPADAQTSTSSGSGLPVGGGAVVPGATGAAPAPALETVPLDLEFIGNFFSLADFFHDIKRFVHVVNEDVVVNGRLVTIEGVNFSSDSNIFPRIRAQLKATVYLAPATQGTTAGATPEGPVPTTPAGTTPAEDPSTTAAPIASAAPR